MPVPPDKTARPQDPLHKLLWKFSVSHNIYMQIVRPLLAGLDMTAENKVKRNLTDTLTNLHKCLWHETKPQPYPGAVAGHFQELLFALKNIDKGDGRRVTIGHDGANGQPGVGGDVVVTHQDGTSKTVQIKVTKAGVIGPVMGHIRKAAAQLTGQTGERPPDNSEKVVYVVVQDFGFDAYQAADWVGAIEEALRDDYHSDHVGGNQRVVASGDLRLAVNTVKVVTPAGRFKFKVNNGRVDRNSESFKPVGEVNLKRVAFKGNGLQAHWDWLIGPWWAERSPTLGQGVLAATKTKGVGTQGAHPGLPYWA